MNLSWRHYSAAKRMKAASQLRSFEYERGGKMHSIALSKAGKKTRKK
jgi:hypothetical protein